MIFNLKFMYNMTFFSLGVFSSLLKLLVTHYPQLCLLQDWLYRPPSTNNQLSILPPKLPLNDHTLYQGKIYGNNFLFK